MTASTKMLRRVIDYFVFGNFYVSICAVVMFGYTCRVLGLDAGSLFPLFVFFASLTSYSFHWYLTEHSGSSSVRMAWTSSHRRFLLALLVISFVCTCVLLVLLKEHFVVLFILGFITFMYTAPKIPLSPFRVLHKIAVLKTTYLALVWTAVTVLLPILVCHAALNTEAILFVLNRLFLIFPICVLFDYRDREADSREGIKNIATVVSTRGLDAVFLLCSLIAAACAIMLYLRNGSAGVLAANLVPTILLSVTYRKSKYSRSDLWYYVFLDGLMMLSGLLYLPF